MGRALAALLLLVALAGCSTVSAPPPGLSQAERAELRSKITDSRWAATGLYPDQRPATPPVTTVSLEEWGYAYVKCMTIAGFDSYVAGPDGSYTRQDGDYTDAEVVANYVCDISFEIEDQYDGWFNDAQLDYVYDYYRQSLVPCLERRGLEVAQAPTRNEFHATFGSWHPYFALVESERRELSADASVPVECPAVPPGIQDSGFVFLWDQPQP